MICENCPSFQGRGRNSYCKMGLLMAEGDMRTCTDFGLTNQRELLKERGVLWIVKKHWKDNLR